ncbi:AEC family transporter [Arthrobacter sp. OAP107]|uniref:AEC family transporter n=1 Tax=Arthrobacter sp. OAP107 TaxID=3156445 RepID=UPI00339818AC
MLIDVFLKVLPLFLGILIGYLASYGRKFQANAEPALNAFVFYVALPALLFVVSADADLSQGVPRAFPALVLVPTIAFSLIAFGIFWLTSRRDLNGSVAASLAATYGNVSYLGIPVMLGILGPAGGLPTVLAQLLHNLIFVLGYPLAHEMLFTSREASSSKWRAAGATITKAIVRSPIIWAIALGVSVSVIRIEVFPPLMDFAHMLAGAAAPGALFAIGLTLRGAFAVFRAGELRLAPVWLASTGKLVLLPAITAGAVFLTAPDMPHSWLITLVLMAGMPTSATAFVLSQASGGEGRTVAAVILVTNILGILTLPLAAQVFT